jgi:hypothetical protein
MIGYVFAFGLGSFCYAVYDAAKGNHTRVKVVKIVGEDSLKIAQIPM